MFSYYGSKANVIKHYPSPKFNKVIEPFAGSARYALEHFDNDVLLVDKWPVIIEIWQWLQSCSENDILSLPIPKPGQSLDFINYDCDSAKKLMGFVVQYGVATPGLKQSISSAKNRPNRINFTIQNIAKQLFKIRHWEFICSSYLDIADQEATWFIDPPYQHGGHKYAMSSLKIDFTALGDWCRSRPGQTIVCENIKADWLPFVPMISQQGSAGKSTEAIWTNTPTHFNNIQQVLF